ncbi:hypothetical protein DFS34DRAFT_231467 [Phlyctochytrium arcticum]|nr:hypothetical protein DFS34DRAFT_231467 [Phlyctochytrium arcticum]
MQFCSSVVIRSTTIISLFQGTHILPSFRHRYSDGQTGRLLSLPYQRYTDDAARLRSTVSNAINKNPRCEANRYSGWLAIMYSFPSTLSSYMYASNPEKRQVSQWNASCCAVHLSPGSWPRVFDMNFPARTRNTHPSSTLLSQSRRVRPSINRINRSYKYICIETEQGPRYTEKKMSYVMYSIRKREVHYKPRISRPAAWYFRTICSRLRACMSSRRQSSSFL